MKYGTHIEKYQAKDIGGIHKEQFREYRDPSKYHNDVDTSRTHMNIAWGDSNWLDKSKRQMITLG